jgi:Domain of unknown function (DUF222)
VWPGTATASDCEWSRTRPLPVVGRAESAVRLCESDGALGTVERLRNDAAKCAEASLWALSNTDLVTAVEQVHRLKQTIAAVELHLIGEMDARGIAAAQQVFNTAAWLRLRLLLDPASARRLVDQAAALKRHPAVDAALREGTIHLRQADSITDALDALPASAAVELAIGGAIDTATAQPSNEAHAAIAGGLLMGDHSNAAELVAAAETALLDFAQQFPPAPLRRLGGPNPRSCGARGCRTPRHGRAGA